ncbi:protein containing PAS domain S-box [Anaerolinea thermolimosa]|uniref:two-component system sensor histidine kinase NtrB n=1 Tax=Anaerolinea thermolimosa TaxID=229919 RepID=UPI000783AA08|nr:sensor histidine kinase [Anaerolinea thermolimosa]GAP06616.1 protein containing PAS domain S-box [Anaerolinea thermolimosa]
MVDFGWFHKMFRIPWQNDLPGGNEFNTVLELIDKPALLVSKKDGLIYRYNQAFLKLSKFEANEVAREKVTKVITGISDEDYAAANEKDVILLRQGQEACKVKLTSREIKDGRSGFYLFILTLPPPNNSSEPELPMEKVTQVIDLLDEAAMEGNFIEVLHKVGVKMAEVLDAPFLCLYQADPEKPRLTKFMECSSEGEIFPDHISSVSLARLARVGLWQPGKRLISDLHQIGHEFGFQYIGTAPLGQPGQLFGLLVVADRKKPAAWIMDALNLFGIEISRFIEHHVLVENLRCDLLALNQSLETFRVITENAQEGILILNPAMEITAMNPAAEWMLGYAEWEVKSQKADTVLIGPDSLIPALEAAARGIPTHNIGNVSLHRRHGQLFPAHIQTIPVSDGDQVVALVVLVTDISENEEIRIRSQQLEQRAILGEVTAVFAHEVRNPINNIYTGLQLLSATLPADDPHQDHLTRLQNDCVRLNHLMESVLNFSRNTQYRFEAIDLALLLKRLLERWHPRFSKVNIHPFFHVENNTPLVYADPRAMEQVFTNLISNATDAMSKNGGNLAVRIGPKNVLPNRPQVVVTVSDDGPGIPDEIRDRIFEPFVTTKSNGTGLGLAITKRIITAHHGSIQVSSFPGGTMFEVTLLAYNGEES